MCRKKPFLNHWLEWSRLIPFHSIIHHKPIQSLNIIQGIFDIVLKMARKGVSESMRKVVYFFLTIVELLLLVGAYLIHYFTKKKMGMARYVIYKNKLWEREYPMELWKTCAILLVAVLTISVVLIYLKRRGYITKIASFVTSTMIVTSALYTLFTTISSTSSMRAYYFISPILGIVAVLQIIKAYAVILYNLHNESTD